MTNILELLKNEKVEWKKLGEVVEILDSKRKPIKKSERIFGNYPYYGANGVQDYVNDYIFDGTFILMGEDGSVMNKNFTPILHWIEKDKIWVNNHAHVLGNSSDCYNLKYIYYYLTTINVSGIVKGTPPKINQANMRDIEIPIPSLEIQEKIVEILDKFTNYVTELQSELQSRTKQYTYYRDKLLSEEYLVKVTKEMEEDRRLNIFKLDEIFDFKNGLNKGRECFGKGVPFISYVNVYKLDRLKEEDIIEKVDLTEDEIARFSVVKGDVLFTRTSEVKEEVGYSSVVMEDLNNTVFNGFTIRARLKNSDLLLPEYSAHLFRCHKIRKEIIRRSSFTTRASLSGQELGKVKVVIPPFSLQNKIVKVLDKFQVLLADTKGLLPAEIEERQKQYEYYREKLLTFDEVSDRFDS